MHFFARAVTILFLVVGVSAAPGRVAAQTALTVCGQSIAGDAFLPADLDCTSFPGYAVTIDRGTLDLGGFTLTGGDFGGVQCPHKCNVVGPGTITGSAFAGIVAFGSLRTSNVDLTNHVAYGLECFKSCKISGGTISGNGDGVVGGANAQLSGVTIVGNAGYGARVANGRGTASLILRDGSTVSNNGDEGVTAERKIAVYDSTVTGNAEHGLSAGLSDCSKSGTVKLRNAIVTGNGTAPDCGVTETCADVASCRQPSVKDGSTCGTSYVPNSGFPGEDWNVCTLD